MARGGALEKTVVALRVEEALLGEARHLETVVDVGGHDEEIVVPHQVEKVAVHVARGGLVAQQGDHPGPERPPFLGGREGVEAARVRVRDATGLHEVGEALLEDRARVGVAVRDGQARARADDDGVGPLHQRGQSGASPASVRAHGPRSCARPQSVRAHSPSSLR